MTRLERPVARHLHPDPVDEAAVERVWTGVRRRVAARPRRARQVATAVTLATAAAAAILVLLPRAGAPGPLRLQDGSPLSAELRADGPDQRRVDLADGSQLRLEPGAQLEVLDNEGSRLELRHAGGIISFAVQPGGPRRWMVNAGPILVEVVGTRFTVERDARGAEVAVEHGTVLVRGPLVPDAVKRLSDGMRLRVDEPARTGAAQGAGGSSTGVDLEVMDADALLAIADSARRGGHPGEAARALASLVARFPDDERAAVAAFTRGRIEADDLGHPAAAAQAFAHALRLGLPEALDEEAGARLVEARWNAGQVAAAREALAELAARHRQAADLARLRRLVGAQ